MARKFVASYTNRIAERLVSGKLLETGAVTFSPKEPVLLASGLLTPVIVYQQAFLSDAAGWRDLIELMVSRVGENLLNPEVVVGTDYSSAMIAQAIAFRMGLPAAVLHLNINPAETLPIAARLGIPASAVQIGVGLTEKLMLEGSSVSGKRALFVTDHISSGSVAERAINVLRKNGATADSILTVTDFGFPKTKNKLAELGVKTVETIPFKGILELAEKKDLLNKEDAAQIRQWIQTPHLYGHCLIFSNHVHK